MGITINLILFPDDFRLNGKPLDSIRVNGIVVWRRETQYLRVEPKIIHLMPGNGFTADVSVFASPGTEWKVD